jgi:hypothetical protein
MMVKPRGCCDRNGVRPDRRTGSNPVRCAKLDKRSLRRGPALRQTAARLLNSRIELRRTLGRTPDVCDYHVRLRVMESLAATEEH